MKYKCFFLFSIITIALTSKETFSADLFNCIATSGEKIELKKDGGKISVYIDKNKITSLDSYESVINTISPLSGNNEGYVEFRSNDNYVSIGDFNSSDDVDTPKNALLLSSKGNGLNKDKKYTCGKIQKNNLLTAE